jgi:hypothetical protein
MKSFYAVVTVIERRAIKVSFSAKEKPSQDEMLEILKGGEFDDILDEEGLSYQSVEDIEFVEGDDE